MSDARILIYGNSGSGKTTMARETAAALGVPHLDLDSITWDKPLVRKTLDASVLLLRQFTSTHPAWVIEGCYGEVVRAALPECTELRFLNPGVEVCIEHCRARPWEPEKFPVREDQDRMLAALIEWVRQYDVRDDEYGLLNHRALFSGFAGNKREYR